MISAVPKQSVAVEQARLLHVQTVFGAHMTAQRVDTTIGGRTVGTEGALRCVRMIVVPSVGDFFAAGFTTP